MVYNKNIWNEFVKSVGNNIESEIKHQQCIRQMHMKLVILSTINLKQAWEKIKLGIASWLIEKFILNDRKTLPK